MAPYSMDLRKRVVRASDSGMDGESVAAKYEVSRAWVHRLLQRRRETGSIAPRTQTKFRREGTAVRLTTRFTPPPAEALVNLLPKQPWILWGAPERGAQPGIPPGRFPPGRRPPGFGPGGPNQPPPRKA